MEKFTKEEKESTAITIVIFLAVFLPLYFLTYTITDPDPLELAMLEGGGGGGGVTINFGNSNDGMGANYRSELLDAATKFKAEQPAPAPPAEEIVGSDDDEAEAVANTKPVERKEPRMQNAKPEDNPKPKPTATPKPEQPRRPQNAALDAMLNNNGDGNTGRAGNQGSMDGSISSGSYSGDGGSGGGRGGGQGSGDGTGTGPGSGSGSGGGSGAGRGTGVGDYNLAGRKALTKPKPGGCNENGTVVVQITVDRSGKVIKAETGRGTNASPCLIAKAKSAAQDTKWDAGSSDKQVGSITYNFKVTD
ncbi:hypothetical protein AM493_00575 [Flavobacterium akiainvivens]|uniref:Energy transducer TonB n=1 Tax=Flavobacterium akiainvivens TaxID=1202724 RepID=A0A0M8MAM3_9FLAO|nr:energy transducer TonB [Flavobacterium akiainvivens]KOS04704.1 hypothetical protein AM493_00575 [Flavobacterium akiainvivens]SFQ64839.1 outer membrane transport energization protein TonB [Flavobacterium akiainvivens]